MPELDIPTAAALRAVRDASRVCRAVSAGAITSVAKSDQSPVTIADFAAQAVVVHVLTAAVHDAVVVGEESAELLRSDDELCAGVVAAARVAWPEADREAVLAAIDTGARRPPPGASYWTLDPIDGTKGFLRREQYAVCLARVDGDTPTIGALACPNLAPVVDVHAASPAGSGIVLVCGASGPVWRGAIEDGPLAQVVIDEQPGVIVITHSVEPEHSRIDRVRAVVERLGTPMLAIPCDSQAKYALVAQGIAHAYLRIPTRPERVETVWDHAAGVALATRTGMRVSDLAGEPLDFSIPPGLASNYGILCAHPRLHADLVRELAALGLSTKP